MAWFLTHPLSDVIEILKVEEHPRCTALTQVLLANPQSRKQRKNVLFNGLIDHDLLGGLHGRSNNVMARDMVFVREGVLMLMKQQLSLSQGLQ